jgi:hypothetical protein
MMLRDARVDYLAWAKSQREIPGRISFLDSGLAVPLRELGLDPGRMLDAEPPATGDRTVPRLLSRRYGVPEDEILPVLGTSGGLFLAAAAILAPGDRVLVEGPGYESLWRIPEALGARVTRFPRREAAVWALEIDRILEAWPEGTRMVLLSDLHNPTGCAAGDAAVARLAREAERRNAWVLVDEVYRDFRSGAVSTARGQGGTVVTVSSLTKVYGLGRARLGWVMAPPAIVERMRSLIDVVHGVDPSPLQPLFTAGLLQADALRERALRTAARGWEIVRGWSRRHPALRLTEAVGGISAWIGLPPGWTGTDAGNRLAENGVAVVPGRLFGDDSGFRMSFGVSEETLRAGLAIMDRVFGNAQRVGPDPPPGNGPP